MKMVNLTAHDVTVINEEGEVLNVYEPSGHVARIIQNFDTYGYINEDSNSVEVVKPVNFLNFDGVTIEPYTVYIVSWLFLQALRDAQHPNLHQFVAPNTNGVPKDHKGAVKGVYNFLVLN